MRLAFPVLLGIVLPVTLALVLSNPRTQSLFATTAKLAFSVAAVSLPVGVFLAVLLVRCNLPFRRTITFLLAAQLLLPLYLVTAAWQSSLGIQGSFTVWFDASRPLLDGARGAIWVHAMAAIPWVVLIVGVGLRFVEPELEEDALTATSARSVLLRITLPRASGAIGVALLWIVVTTSSEMTATDLFQMRTFSEEVYTAFAATSDTTTAAIQLLPGMLLTTALVMTALVGCAMLLPWASRRRPRATVVFQLGPWRWPLLALVLVVLFVLLGVPLLSLGYRAGFETIHADGTLVRSWSATKLLNMITLEMFDGQSGVLFGREIIASLVIGGISAIIAVSIGTLLAWQACRRRRAALLMFLVVAVCLAIPGPLIGKSVIWLLSPFPMLYDSVFAPALAQSVRALPLATLITWYGLSTVDENVLDSARLDGASSWNQLIRIALPMRQAVLTMAVLVAMVISFGDLAASQLVLVPGAETLANRIFDRLHSGAYDQVSGVCLAVIAACLLLAGLLRWLCQKMADNR